MQKNSKVNHVMGATGSGKTYLSYEIATKELENGKQIIFLSNFDDITNSSIEKFFVKDDTDIPTILKSILEKKSIHIIFPIIDNDEEKDKSIQNVFINELISIFKEIPESIVFFDDAQKMLDEKTTKQVIIEAKDNGITLFIIHQYLNQFTPETLSNLFDYIERGYYFRLAKNDIDQISSFFVKDTKDLEQDLSTLEDKKYIVLEK